MTNWKDWSVCALLIVTGCSSNRGVAPVETNSKPQRPRQIEALGRLEPRVGILNLGAMAGTRLGHLEVSEGDLVEVGEALAYVDTHALRLAQHASAITQWKEAEARLAVEITYGQRMIREAELSVEQTKFSEMDIASQEAKTRLHEANLELAERDLKRLEGLDTSLVPAQQSEHQQLVVRRATEELNAARQSLRKLRAADKLNIELANAKLATAQSAMPRLKAAIPIDSLRAAVKLAEQQIEMSIVRAPIAGRIVRVFTHDGETIGQRPILQMTDTAEIVVVAEVYETDIRWVEVGQPAEIFSDALPPSISKLTGTVESIGSTVARNSLMNLDPTRARTDARVVEVRIRVDNGTPVQRLLNLQVSVSIATSLATPGQSPATSTESLPTDGARSHDAAAVTPASDSP